MTDLTDRNYLLQSLGNLIDEEGSRIISQGLASKIETTRLLDDVKLSIIKHIKVSNPSRPSDDVRATDEILSSMAFLHRHLSAIKLPGDFQKIAHDVEDAFAIVELDIPAKDLQFEDVGPKHERALKVPEEKIEKTIEPDLEHATDTKCPSCGEKLSLVPEKLDDEPKKSHAMVLERLEKIAYDLGQAGKHEAAYMVERTIHELEATAGEADMFAEMGQMENQRRNPPAQYSYPPNSKLFGQYQQYVQPLQNAPKYQVVPPAQHPALHPAQPAAPGKPQMQPNPKLQQLWNTLTPQQKTQFEQMRKQRPMEKPEHLIEMIKQTK